MQVWGGILMTASILLYPALAFVLVVLVGVVVAMAIRGADIARAIQNRRYAVLELQSDVRSKEIYMERRRWEVAQAEAEREQRIRHDNKRRALHRWHQEYRALEVGK